MRFPLLLSITLFALPSFAQTPTPPPPQPTPPPGWHAPDDEPGAPVPQATPDPELRATDVVPDEMLRVPRRRSGAFGRPALVPTFALAVAARGVKNHDELASSSMDVWLGARMHPFVARGTPFIAFGSEINFRELPRVDPVAPEPSTTSYTEVVPEMRWGFAFVQEPKDYLSLVFPNVELYGIGGWRIANRFNGNALRLGLGVSAPIVTALSVACEVPIPAMLELTMDVDSMHSGEREFALRFGWHF